MAGMESPKKGMRISSTEIALENVLPLREGSEWLSKPRQFSQSKHCTSWDLWVPVSEVAIGNLIEA